MNSIWPSSVLPACTQHRPAGPAYAPGMMLKLYVYRYLHRLTFSRKLEREASRSIELM